MRGGYQGARRISGAPPGGAGRRRGRPRGALQPGAEHAQMLDQLRGLMGFKGDAEHQQAQRKPADVIIDDAQPAARLVDLLERRGRGTPEPSLDLRRWRVQSQYRSEASLHTGQRARHERRGVACGLRARGAIDPEGPPVTAREVPSDQVPAAPVVDERVRLDVARALRAVAADVVKAQALAIATCGGDLYEVARLDVSAPDRQGRDRAVERAHASAQV